MKYTLFARQLAKLFIAQAKKEKIPYKVNGFVSPGEVMGESDFWDSFVTRKENKNVEIK